MKLFDLDSPLMQALGKMADLMWLNILTFICCIPIITIGPALTAMHYMALKMARNEECYITRGYFKSFKQNFRQATLIWLILLFVILVIIGDFYIMRSSGISFHIVLQVVITVVAVLVLFTGMFVFPVLAKFDNTIWRTFKNAFLMSIMQFHKTILMIILSVLPVVLFFVSMRLTPIVFLFGMSVPAWLSAKLYNKFFKRLEDQISGAAAGEEGEGTSGEEPEEDERIFKDELDESLVEDATRNG